MNDDIWNIFFIVNCRNIHPIKDCELWKSAGDCKLKHVKEYHCPGTCNPACEGNVTVPGEFL